MARPDRRSGRLHCRLACAAVFTLVPLLPATAAADPGTGLLVLADSSVVFGDPEHNLVWRIDARGRASVLVRDRHAHLFVLEPGGAIVGEHLEFIPAGNRWRSSLWRILPGSTRPMDIMGPITADEPFPDGMSLRVDSLDGAYSWDWLDAGHTRQRLTRRHAGTGLTEVFTARGWTPAGARNARPHEFHRIASIAFGARVTALAELGRVSIIHATGQVEVLADAERFPVNADAPVTEPYLRRLWGAAVDAAGAIFVADGGGRQVVRVTPGATPAALGQLRDRFFPVGVARRWDRLYVLEYPDPGSRPSTGPRVRVIDLAGPPRSRVLGATPAL